MKMLALYIFTVFAAVLGCNQTPNAYPDFLKRLNQTTVFEVDQFATPRVEQVSNLRYLADFQVKKTILLDSAKIQAIRTIVFEGKAVDKINHKSCPSLAQYGLHFYNQNNEYLDVIVSNESCPKCQIFASDSTFSGNFDIIDPQIYQLLGIKN
jgi:hypothetical protein